jgi:hypothetical protein
MTEPGLYHKYIILRADGEPVDPPANYFVLRLDTDWAARQAMLTYAAAVAAENPILSAEILAWVASLAEDGEAI